MNINQFYRLYCTREGKQSSKYICMIKRTTWAIRTRLRRISYIYNNNEFEGKRGDGGRRGQKWTEAEPVEGQEKRSPSRSRTAVWGEPRVERETAGIVRGQLTTQDAGGSGWERKRGSVQHGGRVSLPSAASPTLPIRRTQDVSRPTRRPQQFHLTQRST